MSEPIHVYLNLDVVNNSANNQTPLVFSETRNIPFLTNSNNYFASVIRFCLQTSNSLPVFIPDIKLGQSDPNRTIYEITMTFTGTADNGTSKTVSVTHWINYSSNDTSLPTPAPPLTTVDRSSTYYWVYNIIDFVDLINLALEATKNDLIGPVRGIGSAYANFTMNDPFIEYDNSSGLFTLFVDTAVDNNLAIYFNSVLYDILPFPAIYRSPNYYLNNYDRITNVATVLTRIYNPDGTTSDVDIKYRTLTTEFSPVCLWNPVRNIYFSTNTLPIIPTMTQPPKIYSDISLGSNSGLPDILNILTDFEIPVTAQNNYNGEIIYSPQAEYRFIDMNSSFNLNKIDLS